MTAMGVFPDILQVLVVDSMDQTSMAQIAVRMVIRAARKNSYVITRLTDQSGAATFIREEVARAIRTEQVTFPMDYVPISLDECPEISFRIPSGPEITQQLEAIERYNLPVDKALQDGLKVAANREFEPVLANEQVERYSPKLWKLTIQIRRHGTPTLEHS